MRAKILLGLLMLSVVANGIFTYVVLEKNHPSRDLQKKYPLLSKRIFVKDQNDFIINFTPLRTALNDYVAAQPEKVGVYFEYLPSGTSIGVNDREEIKIVSWSKVPLAMSILKKIERKEMNLADLLTIEKKHLNAEFGTLWKQGEGTKISVGELIRFNLVESDNTAFNVLFDQLTQSEIDEVYDVLDIALSEETENEETYLLIAPKRYASIFKSLYLSSFLSKKHSTLILDTLTQTQFDKKIVSGVPEHIPVSHKIGVFSKYYDDRDLFTDCGIIYAPERPYILCVFVENTEEQAEKHMATISSMVYKYVTLVKKENTDTHK
jgi:beta-lactamase class A